MNSKPEMFIQHGTQKVYGLYVIFHEVVYWFRVLKKRVVIYRMDPSSWDGNPANIRDNFTPVGEILGLFNDNLGLIADPLAWLKKEGSNMKHLDLKRTGPPAPGAPSVRRGVVAPPLPDEPVNLAPSQRRTP